MWKRSGRWATGAKRRFSPSQTHNREIINLKQISDYQPMKIDRHGPAKILTNAEIRVRARFAQMPQGSETTDF